MNGLIDMVSVEHSRPGTPTDNGFVESFNERLRDEYLSQNIFVSLVEARGFPLRSGDMITTATSPTALLAGKARSLTGETFKPYTR